MLQKFDFKYFLMQKHVNAVFRLHFRKLVFIGKENIPTDKPIIFAPTHRNALVDALILVYENVKKQVVFLARADIFANPTIAKILNFLKIMPVYRIRDGKENLDKNQQIFDMCGQILKKGSPIALFPEGRYNPHQNLLPLQKAIPRIVLPTEAETDFTLDTHIVPMAFYYTAKDEFLSDLYVTYGKPIRVSDYKELYEQDANQAANILRLDLDARLREYVVDIPMEDYDEISALIDFNATELAKPSFPKKDGLVRASQEIIRRIKELKETAPQAYADKISATKNARQLLKSHGLTSKDFVNPPIGKFGIITRAILLIATAPLAFVGLLNTIFPTLIYKKLLNLFKNKQFISSVRIVSGIFIVPLFYLLQFVLVGLISKNWLCALAYLIASPIVFYFGTYWRKWRKMLMRKIKVRKFVDKNKGNLSDLEV
ncbi:MAG TPA: hypothetical protein GXZ87_05170 [Bacteroidales bacterium]|nr:hypothetical protein [Bacteroidales bacterium]